MSVPPDPDPQLWCRFDPARGTLAVAPTLCDMQAVPESALVGMGFAARIPRARLAAILATLFAGVASGRPFVIPAPFRLAGGRWVEAVLHFEPGRRRDWYGVVAWQGPRVIEGEPRPATVSRLALTAAVATSENSDSWEVPVLATTAAPASDLTFGTYATTWLDAVGPTLARRSRLLYAFTLERYLAALHDVPLADVRRLHAQHVMALLGARGLSTASQRHAIQLVSVVLNHAADTGVIPFNPLAGMRKPRNRRLRAIEVLTPAQLELFVDTVATVAPDTAPALLAMADAGLRIGEAMGLRGEDLDLDHLRLHVVRTVDPTSTQIQTDPKGSKRRTIDITERLGRALEEARRQRGFGWLSEGRFGPVGYTKTASAMRRVLTVAQLPRLRPHALRHSWTACMLLRGAPLKWVSEQLGHSDVALTARVYGRWLRAPRPAVLDEQRA